MTESNPQEKPIGPSWMIWPGIVVALLVGQLTVSFIAAGLALGDPAQVVEPDYYGKALRWEQTRDELHRSAALGWTPTWDIAAAADLLGKREVRLHLTDADDQPIADASVEVLFYHHALSADRDAQPLAHVGDGVYAAALPMRRDGVWQLDLRVTRGETVFVHAESRRVGTRWKAVP